PGESTRQFLVGLSDYAAFVLLPRLIAWLEREAPGVSLVIRNTSRSTGLSMLDDGAVELIAGNFPPPPTHMREALLYEEEFICAVHHDRFDLDDSLELNRYLSLRHLQVSTKGNPSGYVDTVLSEKGLKRNVIVTVSHFLMAATLVDASGLVATEPSRLFLPIGGQLPLRLFPPPLEIPSFQVVQAWHTRHDADPGHQWLRRVLCEVAQLV